VLFFSYGLSKPADEWEEMLAPMPEPQFDWDYLNDHNVEEIRRNITNRKDVGDIDRVVSTDLERHWYSLYII